MLMRLLLFSIVMYFLIHLTYVTRVIYFPSESNYGGIYTAYIMAMSIVSLLIWLLPVAIAVINKKLEHRRLIIFLSLFIPLVGGFMSYFLLRKRL